LAQAEFLGLLKRTHKGEFGATRLRTLFQKARLPSYDSLLKGLLKRVKQIEPLVRVVQVACSVGVDWTFHDNQPCETIRQALDYAWFLQVLTESLGEEKDGSTSLLAQVHTLLRTHDQELKSTGEKSTLFERVKLASVEKIMLSWVKEKQTPRDNRNLSQRCGHRRGDRIWLNIMEAMATDVASGLEDNAEAGYVLALDNGNTGQRDFSYQRDESTQQGDDSLANQTYTRQHSLVTCFTPFPLQWDELYLTWNLCFVLGQFDHALHVGAKLLIPYVLNFNKDPELFLYKRVLALYVTLYWIKTEKQERTDDTPQVSWKDPRLASIWGAVNLKYAQAYQRSLSPSIAGHAVGTLHRGWWLAFKQTLRAKYALSK
jgi:hypothetical protein